MRLAVKWQAVNSAENLIRMSARDGGAGSSDVASQILDLLKQSTCPKTIAKVRNLA